MMVRLAKVSGKNVLMMLGLLAWDTQTSAHADARTTLFVSGQASSIAAHCSNLQLIREFHRVPGTELGTKADWDGARQAMDKMFQAGEVTCTNVCGFRPGTCYFIKEIPCAIVFKEDQVLTLRGRVTQGTVTVEEDGGPRKYTSIKLDKPICFKNNPTDRIDEVELSVSKEWVGRSVVVTGSMKAGEAWSIDASRISGF